MDKYVFNGCTKILPHVGIKKVVHSQKRKKAKKNNKFKKLNEHLDGVLQDYSEK
jgi:hypothetical protein